jgi:transcription antitermination factor NusG
MGDLMLPPERWFAVQVRTGREHSIAFQLSQKGYEIFLPECHAGQRRGNTRHSVPKVLFTGYLFCKFSVGVIAPLVTTSGVVRVVGCGHIPSAVEDEEIGAIRTMIKSPFPMRRHPFLAVGDRVQICSGPLQGLTGFIDSGCGQTRLVVSVMLLQRSVSVQLYDADVLPIAPKCPPQAATKRECWPLTVRQGELCPESVLSGRRTGETLRCS